MKTIVTQIKDENGGHYTMFDSNDRIEFVNPIEYYSEVFTTMDYFLSKEMANSANLPFPQEDIDKSILKSALKYWDNMYKETIQIEIPQNFITLLSSKTKKEQIKLLKNQKLSNKQLLAFIFKAWSKFGYTFSQYKAEFHHKGIHKGDLPTIVEVEGDEVNKVGNTKLSNGQLKHAVKYRKAIISKFIDKGNVWHCFFMTMKSLRGEENWKNGQAHFHYISDKFGHSRDKVIEELTNSNYKLGSLPHIEFSEFEK